MKSQKLLLTCLLFAFIYTHSYGCSVTMFSPLTSVCEGDELTISGIFALSGSTTPRVTWNGSVCSVQSYSSSKIVIIVPVGASGSSISVRDKSNSNCTGTYAGIVHAVPPDLISVTATLPTVFSGQSTTLFANGALVPTAWYENNCNGSSIGSGITMTVTPTTTTTYCARNEGIANNCASACQCITINVIPTGISELTGTSGSKVSLFPNPAGDKISVTSTFLFNHLIISNIIGEIMLEEKAESNGVMDVDVKKLPAGIYLIKVESESREWMGRFVKKVISY